MKNKGFTLIELLAVIVILAIIALIATPIILGIINNAREQAKVRTAELIAKETELAYTSYLFKNNGEGSADSFCTYMTEEFFAMDNGDIGTCEDGVVIVESGSDEYTVTYSNGTVKVTYEDSEDELSKVKLSAPEVYVYMWYDGKDADGPTLNEVINPSDYSTTLPADESFYLKFKLDKTNKVTNAYACVKFNEVEERCLEGGPNDAYGWVTSKTDSTGRVAKLYEIEQEGIPEVSCSFDSHSSNCKINSVYLDACSDGYILAYESSFNCRIWADGSSYCKRF